MTIQWSFSYYSFVKFHGKEIWEPQNDRFITKCVIKELHCITLIEIKTQKNKCQKI